MPRTCIICGRPAGSREHIFPASLGGRRTNKQIYCGEHNEGFSPLAAEIAAQLKIINALLAIRPDHSTASEPHFVRTGAGRTLRIFDGETKRVDGVADTTTEGDPINLDFGGLGALRAIAYIGMTFFAHHFQDWARGDNLVAMKQFVSGEADNDHVWWESAAYTTTMPTNPFRFGHTIVVGSRADTGSAGAVISLFGTLTFAVDLGHVIGASDRTVTVFLDPLADHPPNDIIETIVERPLILTKPDPLQEHLRVAVENGTGENMLQELFRRIERWKFDKTNEAFLLKLNSAGIAEDALSSAILDWLAGNAGRVFKLMEYSASELGKSILPHPQPLRDIVSTLLNQQIARDTQRPSGLSEPAESALDSSVKALSQALVRRFSYEPATLDLLWAYLKTGEGAAIVGQALYAPVHAALQALSDKGTSDTET